ncbi:MAG: peptidyl-prolyl cis-trans isomerase [Dysgonomonas sp.]
MKKIIVGLLSGFVFFFIYSCGEKGTTNVDPSQNPVVTVKGQTLYRTTLNEVLPAGLSAEDSTAAAQSYINMWINDLLMYDKAKQNVTNEEEIETLVQNYRKSLITNIYQEQLLQQQLSRIISENELKTYYEQNKERFRLEENIIKGLYLKVPVGSSLLSNFQKWYKQGTNDAIENIEKNSLQNVVGYEYFYDRWVDFDEVMDNIPTLISDQRQFLQTNKTVEVRDSSFVYLLNIKEYKLEGNDAPYEYIKGHLSEIFAEQRKADFLKQVQKDLYDKAVSDEEIKFYDK